MRNGGAEEMSAEGWQGLENLRRRYGEYGLRRGVGRTGEYAFYWRGQSQLIHSDWVAVDPAKTYELSGYFKAKSGVFTGLTFGVVMADAQQRQIKPYNVFSISGTRTELTAPCRAGDRILRAKNAAGWKTGARFAAAFGVEENKLTFDVTPTGIDGVRPDGDEWVIILSNPCGLDMPAGTPVTQNQTGGGGIFLPGAVNVQIPAEWTELKGAIGPKQWWPGAAHVRVVIIGPGFRQRAENAAPLLMDDLTLKALKN